MVELSVCIVTYNHEAYIDQCLSSLVDQETTFEFEIIVSDDASTDTTGERLEQLKKRYPQLIQLNYQPNNISATANVLSGYQKAKGRYIAHLDDDDSALPHKLQRQFDLLKAHQECVICSYSMRQITKQGTPIRATFSRASTGQYGLIDLYQRLPLFARSSKMFRAQIPGCDLAQLPSDALNVELHALQRIFQMLCYLPWTAVCLVRLRTRIRQ